MSAFANYVYMNAEQRLGIINKAVIISSRNLQYKVAQKQHCCNIAATLHDIAATFMLYDI